MAVKSFNLEIVTNMYSTFVIPSSVVAVNFDAKISNGLRQSIETKNEMEAIETIKQAMVAVECNLQDTLSRFVHTTQYKDWLERHLHNKLVLQVVLQEVPKLEASTCDLSDFTRQ